MISTKDIAWLAGLLEGEGCFRFLESSPAIQLKMTDRDVVERAAGLMGARTVSTCVPRVAHHKTQYGARIFGARAAGWMMTLWPMLGTRRRQKVEECLARWRAVPTRTAAARVNVKKAQAAAATYWAQKTPEQIAAHCAKMRAARTHARRRHHPQPSPAAA